MDPNTPFVNLGLKNLITNKLTDLIFGKFFVNQTKSSIQMLTLPTMDNDLDNFTC